MDPFYLFADNPPVDVIEEVMSLDVIDAGEETFVRDEDEGHEDVHVDANCDVVNGELRQLLVELIRFLEVAEQ